MPPAVMNAASINIDINTLMDNDTQLAFKAWGETFPDKRELPRSYKGRTLIKNGTLFGKEFKLPRNWDGDCPCPNGSAEHSYIIIQQGRPDRMIIRPDSEVCDRERAWRKYVELRDRKKCS